MENMKNNDMPVDINNITPFTGMGEETPTKTAPAEMMVIGVGGGGNNAVKYMLRKGTFDGVRCVACNTDAQVLNTSGVIKTLQLGADGLGAGNKPEVGRAKAEEDIEKITNLLQSEPKPNMVFITAGMGGGTGTGAAPVVARVAKELEILTVGIVTLPFLFEGMPKIKKALAGIEEMRKHVDALLVINNERLREIYPDLVFMNAFSKADDILAIAVESIMEIIVREGYINRDFNDVRTTLLDGGTAIISTGYGEGENRVTNAIEDAIRSPLLKNTDIYSSKRLLFVVYISPDQEQQMTLSETEELTAFTSKFSNTPDVIPGVYLDETLGNKMKITILASGFDTTEVITPTPGKTTQKKDVTPTAIASIEEEYGEDVVRKMKLNQLQLALLTREQIENDAVLEMFDAEPTYNRSTDFKQRLSAAATQRTTEQPTSTESNNKTINF